MASMKLELRVPYYVHPPQSRRPILLFLHGIGEGFVNKSQSGHDNALRQGPPKHLETLGPNHPLLNLFTLIVPQLPDRQTLWDAVVDDLHAILAPYRSADARLYLVGFSKGGLGAFQVAGRLGAAALVTIDASPMDLPARDALARRVNLARQPPFWAIYTSYTQNEDFWKIQEFNELLTDQVHSGLDVMPAVGRKIRTLEEAPPGMAPVARHVWLCDQVSACAAPYEWLLRH